MTETHLKAESIKLIRMFVRIDLVTWIDLHQNPSQGMWNDLFIDIGWMN